MNKYMEYKILAVLWHWEVQYVNMKVEKITKGN
jgi:hypothetical protein